MRIHCGLSPPCKSISCVDTTWPWRIQMRMTSEQVKAIQDSFAKVAPISEQAAEIFYGRLFEIAPAVKPLFRGYMKEQGKKLMAMVNAVYGLIRPELAKPSEAQ